jgi:hypothetical protein
MADLNDSKVPNDPQIVTDDPTKLTNLQKESEYEKAKAEGAAAPVGSANPPADINKNGDPVIVGTQAAADVVEETTGRPTIVTGIGSRGPLSTPQPAATSGGTDDTPVGKTIPDLVDRDPEAAFTAFLDAIPLDTPDSHQFMALAGGAYPITAGMLRMLGGKVGWKAKKPNERDETTGSTAEGYQNDILPADAEK